MSGQKKFITPSKVVFSCL